MDELYLTLIWVALSLLVGFVLGLTIPYLDKASFINKFKKIKHTNKEEENLSGVIQKIWGQILEIESLFPRKENKQNVRFKYDSNEEQSNFDMLNLSFQKLELVIKDVKSQQESRKNSRLKAPLKNEKGLPKGEDSSNTTHTSSKDSSFNKESADHFDVHQNQQRNMESQFWQKEDYLEDTGYKKMPMRSTDPLKKLIDIYNKGVRTRSERQSFWTEFDDIYQIGNKKAVEQSQGKSEKIEFKEVSNGDFLAVKNTNDGNYLVVPQFDITIKDTTYQEGGIGTIFDCPNYNPEETFTDVKVARPAVFSKNGDNWEFIQQGELIL